MLKIARIMEVVMANLRVMIVEDVQSTRERLQRVIAQIDGYEIAAAALEHIFQSQQSGIPVLGIGKRCHITNTIIDKNCRIGDDVIINGGSRLQDEDHPLYSVKDGIVVIKKGAVLPNGFVI